MKEIEITQFKNGKFKKINDLAAEEAILHLEINDEVSFDVIITPNMLKEFVYGNLYTEGFIKNTDDVGKYQEQIKKSLVNVKVEIKNFSNKKEFYRRNYNIVWTECGSGPEIKRYTNQIKRIDNEIKINANEILKIFDQIKDKIDLFKQTGAFHYAFLFNKNMNLITFANDIGRHNAVDKVVGSNLLQSGKFNDKILYITGRISSDIVLKCLRTKIPMLISRGAALDSAINLAQKYNLCLIGFLRGKRFNIYSNPEAIIQ